LPEEENNGKMECWNNGKVTRYETRDIGCRGWGGVKKKETANRKNFMSLLRMRCYSHDRNHSSLRAVIPEDSVGSWSFLLDIRLEDLFPVRSFERPKFVRLQRRMA